MSTYEWERGEVKFPTTEFGTFKKNLISAMVRRHEDLFNKANRIYETISAEKKGKKNFDVKSRIYEILNPRDSWGSTSDYSYDEQDLITKSLLNEKKLVKPKKKDFTLKNKEFFSSEELTVRLDSKNKTLHWDVSENNHAVDTAHSSFLGKTTMSLLKRVNFTNRTGGYFEGNDEYNQDSGDGANYVTHRFGKYANKNRILKEFKLQMKLLELRQ